MKTNSARARQARLRLDRAEWDFSQCPASELIQCYWYEYARESKGFCLHYEASKQKAEGIGASGHVTFADGSQLSLSCPEFPQTPWLEISPVVRKTRLWLIRWIEPAVALAYSIEYFSLSGQSSDLISS